MTELKLHPRYVGRWVLVLFGTRGEVHRVYTPKHTWKEILGDVRRYQGYRRRGLLKGTTGRVFLCRRGVWKDGL